MIVNIRHEEKSFDVSMVKIEINGCEYRLSESVDGRLTVNKISLTDNGDDYIKIHPRSGNEVDLS